MSNLYHFVTRSINSNKLTLNRNYQIPNRIGNCLTDFQHHGINFLYEHFEKHTSCILNLESGLGKTALVSVFLDTVLPHDSSRKCLIIVKNDERVINWQFHLDVLTNLSSKVVFEEKEIGKQSVYITKWESLRSSISLTNINFDCIIVDDRSDLLTNKICLAYLLRNYENKISLVISSNDVSIDLKQFHSILRLCGRLDSLYLSFKNFEEYFSLPRITGLPNDRNTLESYFLRRERIINFSRDFCLRHYRHQFEDQLPLCQPDVYKQSIKRWQESGTKQFQFLRRPIAISKYTSFESCQILTTSSSSTADRDTEELFKSFFNNNEEEELNAEVTRITKIASENDSNENSQLDNVLMSPLLFIPDTDDEKLEHTVSSTTKDDDNRNIIQPTPIKKKITNSPVKRREKRLREQNDNEITARITRSMDRLTRSKSQKSKYILLDIESTLKRDSNIKALKKRIKNNQNLKKNKETTPINNSILVSSTISPTLNTKTRQGKKNQNLDVDDKLLLNGQQFGDYINEVDFVENINNNNYNNANINYSNCNYETQCDSSIDRSLILPDTSEIEVMSQSEPIVITLSSSSDSSIGSTTNNKNKPRISLSPDLFSTYDEFNISCSQKNQTNQIKKTITFSKNSKEMENFEKDHNTKSYLDILETNLEKNQGKHSTPNKCSSKDTDSIICIDLDEEQSALIDNSIMERNLLLGQHSNLNFRQQKNKITKYLCNEPSPTPAKINDNSPRTSASLAITIENPKTPKRKISERNSKMNSLSKKTANTKNSPTTPNSLRNWLITPSSAGKTSIKVTSTENTSTTVNEKTTKRRRLDQYFEI